MTNAEVIARNTAHELGVYARQPVAFVRGLGAELWDAEGKRYLDFFAGLAVNNLGHCHPAVVDVAVFGIPHEEWGEEIKAVVQPADGVAPGPALTSELLRFLDGRLAKFKQPKRVLFVDDLPRNTMGKVQKNVLRDLHKALYVR